ncbi:hypothetical protein ACEWY4_007121 [Coilia grayii]|uniref:MAGUK p55 subfamily member 7 n=1 Tax=Coilia grayii TaxID=363190 RepID=A0ABD1KFL8_9TELE
MDESENSNFLQDTLMGSTLHLLIRVYERLLRFGAQRPKPIQDSAVCLAGEVNAPWRLGAGGWIVLGQGLVERGSRAVLRSWLGFELAIELKQSHASPEAAELCYLLSKPHIKSLLSVHDSVAQKAYDPELPPLPDNICDEEEDSVKIVRLVKKEQPLAFVRVLFHYDPEDDPAIPCKLAGLAFKRGDVLEIVCQEDELWWQARHHGTNSQAGLIPSRELQERRVTLQKPEALFRPQRSLRHGPEDADYGAITGIHIAGLRKSFRLSRQNSESRQSRWRKFKRLHPGPIPTYLEVVPYHRGPADPHRLVLMFGPSGVGLSELKRRLLLSDPELFSVTIPHTSRKRRRQEKEGVEYHFVSRHTFEKDILNHKFIEYGEHGGNYYGTSLESVQKVLAECKVCLLDVEPQTVEKLYTREFKPYVVFVKPPPIERLRLSRRKTKVISSTDERTQTKTLMEEDFEDMIASGQAMESQYGHLVEEVIVNDDLAVAFTELRSGLRRIEQEIQWIPADWAQD